MSLVWLVLLLVAALVALAVAKHAKRHRRSRAPARCPFAGGRETRETYKPIVARRAAAETPAPRSLNPLAPQLARALDRTAPADVKGQDSPWSYDEVRGLGNRAVARINARNDGLDLAMVSFDAVSKTVDEGKTLRYQFDAQLHSVKQNLSARVTMRITVTPQDTEFIKDIAVHGSAADASAVRGSASIGGHVDYATYEPVARYVPQPV